MATGTSEKGHAWSWLSRQADLLVGLSLVGVAAEETHVVVERGCRGKIRERRGECGTGDRWTVGGEFIYRGGSRDVTF